ncbi:hypothetical protein NP233_g8121 [Leucocoprinus birnbaumii]|uniref:Uncharacterized protein n=1 Tax=Leucocoprinus birnbaumii TaxID=56174 RepID=A0AAD5YU46_9AGAR|nr:hypothetical protein NP233_g8121 [Leucocoprinus birnbaumii]
MSNPYAPSEPASVLWFEQVYNAGLYVGSIAYGIHISAYFMCVYHLLKSRMRHYKRWLVIVSLLFALGTVNLCFNLRYGQLAWIDNRNYPGGPPMFLQEMSGSRLLAAGDAESILVPILTDGILSLDFEIYRCYILYRRLWLVVIPVLALLASFVCGVLLTIQAAHPGSSLWAQRTFNFALPYFAISMGLNMLLSIMLVGRLLYMRARIQKVLGREYTQLYATLAVMITESALPYGLVSLIFLTLYATKNAAAQLFLALYVQVECMSPIVIMLRVARGKAWSLQTMASEPLTSIKFKDQHQKHHVASASFVDGRNIHQVSMALISGTSEYSEAGTGRTTVAGSLSADVQTQV